MIIKVIEVGSTIIQKRTVFFGDLIDAIGHKKGAVRRKSSRANLTVSCEPVSESKQL